MSSSLDPKQSRFFSSAVRRTWSGFIHGRARHHGQILRYECICMLRETGSNTDWFLPDAVLSRTHLRDVEKKQQKQGCDRLSRGEEEGAKLFIRCVTRRSRAQIGFFMERSSRLIDTALSSYYSLSVKPNLIHCLSRSLRRPLEPLLRLCNSSLFTDDRNK